MNDDDGLAVLGTVGAIVLGVVAGVPWFWIPAGILLVIEILALMPAHDHGVPAYRHEQAALDEIADRLRETHRSLDAD